MYRGEQLMHQWESVDWFKSMALKSIGRPNIASRINDAAMEANLLT